jgi:hypothetical protein
VDKQRRSKRTSKKTTARLKNAAKAPAKQIEPVTRPKLADMLQPPRLVTQFTQLELGLIEGARLRRSASSCSHDACRFLR